MRPRVSKSGWDSQIKSLPLSQTQQTSSAPQ
jgi:hypothetical protein